MLNTFRKGMFALYVFYDVDIIFIAMKISLDIAFITDPQQKENKCSGYVHYMCIFGDLSEQCLGQLTILVPEHSII